MNVGQNKTTRILAGAAVLALVAGIASAGAVWAQATNAGNARAWRGLLGRGLVARTLAGRAMRQLNVTDQQKQQIKDILAGYKDQIAALADQGVANRRALHAAIAADDVGKISAASQAIAAAQLKGNLLRAEIRAKVFGQVLTPEQRDKAAAMQAQFEQRFDQWWQRRRPGWWRR